MEGSDFSKFGGEHGIRSSLEVIWLFRERSLRDGRRKLVRGERVAWEGGLGSLVGGVVGRGRTRSGVLKRRKERGDEVSSNQNDQGEERKRTGRGGAQKSEI